MNPEKVRAVQRAYRERNREALAVKDRERYAADPARRAYYAENSEAVEARRRERWATDPEARETRKSQLRRYWRAGRAFIAAAKGDRCQDCGGRFPSERLHFHHRDPATKLFDLAHGATRRREAVLAEIVKCDVLCEPCHKARHRAMETA